MKRMRLCAAVGALSLLAAMGLSALPHAQEDGGPVFSGGSFLTTIRYGNEVASRSVITLHADHTMLAVDSAEQGPNYYFGSQLGVWKPAGNHRVLGRLINFRYPQNPSGSGVARVDYVINFAPDRRHVTGTISVTAFPLQEEDPFGDGGTLIANVAFDGQRIEP